MNQRAVLIVLVALFVTCFVGSCAVGTLTVVNTVASGVDFSLPERVPDPVPVPSEPTESSPEDAPPEITPVADPDSAPGETAEPDYEAPVIGDAQLAVFHLEKPKVNPWLALQKAAKGTHVLVLQGDVPDSAVPPYLTLETRSVTDYAVITGPALDDARGLSPQVKADLPKAKTVSVLQAITPVLGASMLEVSKVAAAFAQATGGVLWDEESQEYFSLEAFRVRRIGSWEKGLPQIAMNDTVFVDTAEKGVDLRTAGLRHFGLPELSLKGVPRTSQDAAVSLLNAISQTLVEQKEAPQQGLLKVDLATLRHVQQRKNLEARVLPGGKKRVDVLLLPDADAKVATLAVSFPGSGSPTERTEAAIDAFFGSKDEVNQLEHDGALTELSKQQMAVFAKSIKPRFKKGLKHGEVLLVKAPFQTSSGGTEWMWVEVSKLGSDGQVEGLLANEPDDVPDLRSGSEVIVSEATLFDWMLKSPNGTSIGNETGKVMQERLGK